MKDQYPKYIKTPIIKKTKQSFKYAKFLHWLMFKEGKEGKITGIYMSMNSTLSK